MEDFYLGLRFLQINIVLLNMKYVRIMFIELFLSLLEVETALNKRPNQNCKNEDIYK